MSNDKVVRAVETIVWVEKQLTDIEEDERYSYPIATVFINAPLALVQLNMKSRHDALTSVYEQLTGRKRKGLKPHTKGRKK